MDSPKQQMLDFLHEQGFSGNPRIRAHVIPTGGIKRKLGSSRLLLAGDAAGFVDAFSGEGLAYAIRSGQFAAEIVSRAVLLGQASNITEEYEAACRLEFGLYLEDSLWFEKTMHCILALSFKLAVSNEEITGSK